MMFMPNPDRQINVSSGSNFNVDSVHAMSGFNLNPLPTGVVNVGQPISSITATTTTTKVNNNMMDSYKNFWSHTVPTNMPWAQPILTSPTNVHPLANQPFIMRFTAGPSLYDEVCAPDPCTSQTATEWELLNKLSSGTGTCTSNLHLKRRNSSDDDDDDESIRQPPTKQYISEDKVAAKFNEMSISGSSNNNSIDLSKDLPGVDEVDDDLENVDDKTLCNANSLILSTEVQQALASRDDRIEKIFQEEMSKATKAIVLWQPPLGILQSELSVYKKEEKEKENAARADNCLKSQDDDYLEVDFDVLDSCIDANEMMDL